MDKNTVIIVEGKNDENVLKSFFPNIKTYSVNGLGINKSHISTIGQLAKTNKIILFTDPDGPGEKIRKRIQEDLKINLYHAFIEKGKASTSKKVGVEHATKQDIENSLKDLVEFEINTTNTITWKEFVSTDYIGRPNSKDKRIILCKKLNISYCNAKQLFKRLNMMQLKLNDII